MSEGKPTITELLKGIAKYSFIIGLILAIGGYCLNWIIGDFLISWNQETAKATVLSVEEHWEEKNDRGRVEQVFNFTYRFTTPSGESFEGTGKSSSEPPEVITIDYDSSRPENNRLHEDSLAHVNN